LWSADFISISVFHRSNHTYPIERGSVFLLFYIVVPSIDGKRNGHSDPIDFNGEK